MQAWPIYADVRFGSFKAFFDSAAQAQAAGYAPCGACKS